MGEAARRNQPCACGSGRKHKVCCGKVNTTMIAKPHRDEPAFIICMPTRGAISLETTMALSANMDGVRWVKIMVGRKPIIEARNKLAKHALDCAKAAPFEFVPSEYIVVWIDDDAWWPPSTFSALSGIFREFPCFDAIAGWFGKRVPFSEPVARRAEFDALSYPKPGVDCKHGEIVDITVAGFHFFAHRLNVLERLEDEPFNLPPEEEGDGATEDIAFCRRMIAAGMRIGCATGMPILHVDPTDGTAYVPGMATLQFEGNTVRNQGAAVSAYRHTTPDGTLKDPSLRTYGITAIDLQMENAKRQREMAATA